MEYRLFFIGIGMGLFAWISRGWQKEGGPRTRMQSAAWHGLFWFLAAMSGGMILAMSLETRARFISVAAQTLSIGDVYPAFGAGLICGAIGFALAWKAGRAVEKRKRYLLDDLEWADTVFSAAFMASLLMMFVLQAFKIPSASMQNTLLIGDHLFVNKFLYGLRVPFTGKRIFTFSEPKRGDIVVFQFPIEDPNSLHCGSVQFGKDFIKRLIAVPGDVVEVRQGRVFINGQPQDKEPYAVYADPYRESESPHARELPRERYQELWQTHQLDAELNNVQRDFFGPVTVPPGAYFMMGDNRDRSCDSRYWGPVESRYVKGKAWFLYWPPSRMGAAR